MANRITHIRIPNSSGSAEQITHVRVVKVNGITEYTIPQVIRLMKDIRTSNHFYVQVGELKIYVTYHKAANGKEYIRTEPDLTRKDTLLNLPKF